MKKLYILICVGLIMLSLIGCGKKEESDLQTQEKNNSEVTKDQTKKAEDSTFSGEATIETESSDGDKCYLSWYKEDELIIGLLPQELMTEYNYPQGTKVKIEAVEDGTVTTSTGKPAYKITSIEYLEDIDAVTEDDESFKETIEGVAYIEKLEKIDGETYAEFSLENEPDYYYYGKISNADKDMEGKNYYIYAMYNDGDIKNNKQYCEITSWEEYSYNLTDTDNEVTDENNNKDTNIEESMPVINEDYDSAYYNKETGIWLIGNTMTNGKPFKIEGIEYLYIEDGYLYFMGNIDNTSKKDYQVDLNVTIRDKDGNILSDYIAKYNYVFTYDKSIDLSRGALQSEATAKGLTIQNKLPAKGSGYFTCEGAKKGFKYDNDKSVLVKSDDTIDDVVEIRKWNREPYYIYVTVNDYK